MARGRMISKSLGSSRRFAAVDAGALTEFAQLVYVLIVSHTDDFGRLEGDAETIKMRVFPAAATRTVKDFAKALEALHKAGLVIWYQVKGKDLLEVTQFSEHQSGLHKRTSSKFPDPPGRDPQVEASSNNHDGASAVTLDRLAETPYEEYAETRLTEDARKVVEAYPAQYRKYQKQPYLQSRIQVEKDLEAAKVLCAHYTDKDVMRIVEAFLKIKDSHPKAKLLKGSRRTLPMLLTMADPIATQLKIKGVE
jgi:hypothetical protein